MRQPDRTRAGLPCHREQRFETEANAKAFAARNNRAAIPVACEHCQGHHVRRPTDADIEAMKKRSEAERLARLAAYAATPVLGRKT